MSIYIKKNTETNSGAATGGIGFFGLLTVLFIGLKLTNYITWSWWLVLLPMYGPLVIFLTLVLVGVLIYAAAK
jgi:hypothetical protein